MQTITWHMPPDPVSLGDNDVDVWRVRLDLEPVRVMGLRRLLTDEECNRADRFHLERHRLHWTVSRASLRWVLAQYVGLAPAQLCFKQTDHGKPYLAPSGGLRFNLSHSGDLALIAVTRGREVGVDVERIRTDLEVNSLARTAFSPWEASQLAALPLEQQVEAFFNCWSRKESFIKAVGYGVSFGMDRFDVSLSPDHSAGLLRVDREGYQAEDWSLRVLDPGPGYKGALTVQGYGWVLRCWELAENFR